MSATRNSRFIEKWVGYLNDIDREMSLIAAQKLGGSGDPAVVPDLIKALKGRPDDVRLAAVRALGSIGDAEATPALIKALDDNNVMIASAAADALGMIRDERAVPALVKILSDYKNNKTRHNQIHGYDRGLYTAAINSLEKINTRDARLALRKYDR